MKTIINIKTDREIKMKAAQTAREMGLPLSTVVNSFLKKFIIERQVSFSAPLKPSLKLAKILRRTSKDIETGKNLSGPFYSAKEMANHLDSLK
ncbi:MAG: type II toxin-antitoxin system RelB/DinJ family antitoxin [Candidatus Vogelbacteria bacterium]